MNSSKSLTLSVSASILQGFKTPQMTLHFDLEMKMERDNDKWWAVIFSIEWEITGI